MNYDHNKNLGYLNFSQAMENSILIVKKNSSINAQTVFIYSGR